MQAIDLSAIEDYGIPSLVLMENAGRGIATQLLNQIPNCSNKKFIVVCGKGNNGGDGFVIARHLANKNISVQIVLCGKLEQLKSDAKINADIARKMSLPIKEINADNWSQIDHSLRHADVIVDAIFGTGLSKAVDGWLESLIEKINKQGKFIASVDIPSGIDSDCGQIIGPHIRAHHTFALAQYKRCQWIFPSAEAMGKLQLVDIGIPHQAVASQAVPIQMIQESDLVDWLPQRSRNSHKGSYGHVLVIAGSRGKAGAAGLTSLAVLRSGCGLVTLALPESCQKHCEFNPMEVMTVPLPETSKGVIHSSAKEKIIELCRDKSAVAIGPGITTQTETIKLLEEILPQITCPLVIDADGLNCLAKVDGLLEKIQAPVVLTPHPKEMSRLTGLATAEIQRDRIKAATDFIRNRPQLCLLLKGASTVIATPDGHTFINPTGNSGMATAGSGDVLTGIIAGLLAQGLSITKAAVAGAYIHGLAGDQFADKQSQSSLIAGDLLRELPQSLKRILP
jgi:NAD(P)H-hydrate epimerase